MAPGSKIDSFQFPLKFIWVVTWRLLEIQSWNFQDFHILLMQTSGPSFIKNCEGHLGTFGPVNKYGMTLFLTSTIEVFKMHSFLFIFHCEMNCITFIHISSALMSLIILKTIVVSFSCCLYKVPFVFKYKYYSLHHVCFKKQYFLILTKVFFIGGGEKFVEFTWKRRVVFLDVILHHITDFMFAPCFM